MRYHGLPYSLPYMLPCCYQNFAILLLATILSTLAKSVTKCYPIQFQLNKYIAMNFPTRYHVLSPVFFKYIDIHLKKLTKY